jgi:hypothetical protein
VIGAAIMGRIATGEIEDSKAPIVQRVARFGHRESADAARPYVSYFRNIDADALWRSCQ